MLHPVALHEERNWFQLDAELHALPEEQQRQVRGRIARDMGQRSGVAPLGYPAVAILLFFISADVREQMDWLWLPSLGLMLSGVGEFVMGRRLAVAEDGAIHRTKQLYQLFSLISALSWGMYTGLVIVIHEGNPLSMLMFLCTAAATSISVGSQTQEKSHWLYFLALMWTPIAASTAIVAGIHKESEVLLFAILAVAFPVLVGTQGLRLVAEYLEAQLDRSALENRTLDLEEALIKQQLAEKARSAMEVQLRHAQKLESIGQLAAGIAHEINTPIQFVGDNTRFLQEAFADIDNLHKVMQERLSGAIEGKLSIDQLRDLEAEYDLGYLREEIPKSLAQSQDGLSRIANIVSAMKEFSHPGSRDKELFDINRSITTSVEVSRNEWKYVADLECQLDESLPLVSGYSQELDQVFLNMIVNAAHAIKEKSEAGDDGKGLICISTQRMPDGVEIVIQDNGVGIPDALIAKIYDPFFTTKIVGKGSGQGLAIPYSIIVDKHAGMISVNSQPGEGTTFTLRLPGIDKNKDM
ncbi:MAG: ATP-binding protein [Sedimenticola sp.]|nr:ATP-binding protein [Sedimenticola sp.]